MTERMAEAETMSSADLSSLQEKRFRVQWNHLWGASAFYRRKLAEAGLHADRPPPLDQLQDVPFTLKSEIRASAAAEPPFGAHLAVAPETIRQVQTSAGTSGTPSLVAITAADAQSWAEILRRGYVAVGYESRDIVLHAFSMSQGWVGGIPMVEGLFALGATVLPIGAEAGSERLLRFLEACSPTAVQATPGMLVHLAEQAGASGLDPAALGVRRLLTGGEPGGGIPEVRDRIESLWGAGVREVMGGADISCLIWAECERQDGMHMMAPDFIYAELVDPQSGEPVAMETGAVGELVYTHLQREACPVLRFRHRDLVRVISAEPCTCGRNTPRIRCFGRADDMLIVKGVNLFPTAVQSVIGEVDGIGPDFRIVKPAGVHTLSGPVELKIEQSGADAPAPEAVADLLRSRLSCRFSVTYVPYGSLTAAGATKSRFFEEVTS